MSFKKELFQTGGLLIALSVGLFGIPTLLGAAVFNVDGYVIDVDCKYSHKRSRLKSTGTIKGGQKCRKLNVELRFTNGRETIRGKKIIRDYQPTAEGTKFEHKEKYVTTFSKKRQSKLWRPFSVKVHCEQ